MALIRDILMRTRNHRLYWIVLNELEGATLVVAALLYVTRFTGSRIKKLLLALIARVEVYTNKERF